MWLAESELREGLWIERLDNATRGRGAFRRFKGIVYSTEHEGFRWGLFSAERRAARARQLLAERGLRPRLTPRRRWSLSLAELNKSATLPAPPTHQTADGSVFSSRMSEETGRVTRSRGFQRSRRDRGLLVAHRSRHDGGFENVIASMYALPSWVDGIETDVRITSDGVPILMHDRSVDRTTDGAGPVSEMALSRIREFDAGGGERVPSLGEFLDACVAEWFQVVLLDMKDASPECLDATAAVVASHDLAGDCIVMVRGAAEMAMFRRIDRELRLGSYGITVDNVDAHVSAALTHGAELLLTQHEHYLPNRAVVPVIQAAGVRAGSSTNNHELREAREDGCDVILTDVAEGLARY